MDIEVEPLPPDPRRTPPGARFTPPPPPPAQGYLGTFLQSCMVAGCATLLVPVLLISGFFVLMYYLSTSTIEEASGAFEAIIPGGGQTSNFRERVVRAGSDGSGTIAIVAITGAIDGSGSTLDGDGMLAAVAEQLRLAGEDASVRAVLLQVDSPGGGLTASDQLYNEVRNLRAKGKKVVAWAGDMMASGGYYIAVAAEGIMASPTATVGSIGVIMRRFQVEELMKKIGVKAEPITSGAHKDIGSPFRDLTPEERRLLQEYVDQSHRRFVDIVATNRNLEMAAVEKLADGTIYNADKAMASGLVDRVGYVEEAIAWLEELAGESDMRVVSYRRRSGFSELFREAGHGAAQGAIQAASDAPAAPRAMAVWEGE